MASWFATNCTSLTVFTAFNELTLHDSRPAHVEVQDLPTAPRNQPFGRVVVGDTDVVEKAEVPVDVDVEVVLIGAAAAVVVVAVVVVAAVVVVVIVDVVVAVVVVLVVVVVVVDVVDVGQGLPPQTRI